MVRCTLRPRFSGETTRSDKARPVSWARLPRYTRTPSVAPPTRTRNPITLVAAMSTFVRDRGGPRAERLLFGVDYLKNLHHVREFENGVNPCVHAEQHKLAFQTLGFLERLDHDGDSRTIDVAYRGQIDHHFGRFL